ncbi:hypothetical protein E2562_008989 [Oryza meyeriana var. granulata]|uniref:Uncharacterized protein n=1 Tax=Oryza meyeriana var. granulata TaxID=110450 RepID=A0A6G1D0X3_9ORYZ|nr:hypothetical protein E2562_008989 [Oryza meyeriana var. granulata]
MEEFVKQFEETEWRVLLIDINHQCRSQVLAALGSSRKKRGANDSEPSLEELQDRTVGDNDPMDEQHGTDPTLPGQVLLTARGRIWTPRASNSIPTAPETHASKKVLIPVGGSSWKQVPFNKKDRMPNTIIGALLRHHYPQKARYK